MTLLEVVLDDATVALAVAAHLVDGGLEGAGREAPELAICLGRTRRPPLPVRLSFAPRPQPPTARNRQPAGSSELFE